MNIASVMLDGMTDEEVKAWPRKAYVRKPCGFRKCGRAHYARGLCNGHYQQKRRGQALEPLLSLRPEVQEGLQAASRRARSSKPCKFDGCDRPNYGGGLCNTHYMQKRRGFELKPIRSPRPDAADGFAWCGKCTQFVDEAEFSWDFKRQEHRHWCRACMREAQYKSNARNGGHEAYKQRKRLRKYGITAGQFDALLAEQEGKCAICRQPGDLHIDHCHVKQSVRGLLCGPCNRALGSARDDVTVLQAAIAYLERCEQRTKSTGG